MLLRKIQAPGEQHIPAARKLLSQHRAVAETWWEQRCPPRMRPVSDPPCPFCPCFAFTHLPPECRNSPISLCRKNREPGFCSLELSTFSALPSSHFTFYGDLSLCAFVGLVRAGETFRQMFTQLKVLQPVLSPVGPAAAGRGYSRVPCFPQTSYNSFSSYLGEFSFSQFFFFFPPEHLLFILMVPYKE